MAKLNKEAVGQYNYLAAEDTLKRTPAPAHDTLPYDASVDLVEWHPRHMQLVKLKPPKLFESAYHSDFRPPPKENLVGLQSAQSKRYTSKQSRTKLKSAPTTDLVTKGSTRATIINDSLERKNRALRSLLEKSKAPAEPRAKTADPTVARYSEKARNDQRKTADFQRAILQGRSEWKHVEPKSYDILNPDKPNQLRETNPYGATLENMQETVAQKYMDDDSSSMRTGSSMSLMSDRLFIESRPHTQQTGRSTRRSGTVLTEKACNTDINAGLLETIEEEGDENTAVNRKATGRESRKSNFSVYGPIIQQNQQNVKQSQPIRQLGKIKAKKVNLFERKLPDKRFYKPHRMRQTPNEMNRYKKMRNRTFFKPLEQAIPEKDFIDHEVKYQPERQLLMDARAHIRQDLKNVRTKNINSLVDRFAQRAELRKEEKRGRLGLPTYAGRDPVSIYKLSDTIPENNLPRTDIKVQLPVRRRITPSIGSVQRARNLSTYANVWNQPSAPPYWGPQKVDHGIYLPAMAVNS